MEIPEHGVWRSTMRSGGRVTVPAAVRRALQLSPGDVVVFHRYGDDSVIMSKAGEDSEAEGGQG